MKFLAALATICVCSRKYNSNWLANYIHTCTNETHSVAYLPDLIPTLASKCVLPKFIAAKVGIKSGRYATECVSFVHVWM